ncbi:hypothetical protein BJY00DRAFT_30744 [Aspergillus carlsbadensis]|nr:hypothetical protein BJY00DRAFT_30744 [Aspergillus carlsbadensis]
MRCGARLRLLQDRRRPSLCPCCTCYRCFLQHPHKPGDTRRENPSLVPCSRGLNDTIPREEKRSISNILHPS